MDRIENLAIMLGAKLDQEFSACKDWMGRQRSDHFVALMDTFNELGVSRNKRALIDRLTNTQLEVFTKFALLGCYKAYEELLRSRESDDV